MIALSDYQPGTRVRYIGKAVPLRIGQTATVKRPIKSRNVVCIEWDSGGPWYDAYPASLEIISLPGTGPDAVSFAKRKAAAPLKPAKPQEPCDIGLFSDDSLQTDLVDMARR